MKPWPPFSTLQLQVMTYLEVSTPKGWISYKVTGECSIRKYVRSWHREEHSLCIGRPKYCHPSKGILPKTHHLSVLARAQWHQSPVRRKELALELTVSLQSHKNG